MSITFMLHYKNQHIQTGNIFVFINQSENLVPNLCKLTPIYLWLEIINLPEKNPTLLEMFVFMAPYL